MVWLMELSQVPLTSSGVTIAAALDRCVKVLCRSSRCKLTQNYCPSFWLDSLLLPVYVAGISGLTLLLQTILYTLSKSGRFEGTSVSVESQTLGLGRRRFRQILDGLGGGTIFAYKLIQLLSILGLLGISAARSALQNASSPASYDFLGTAEVIRFAQCALYVSHRETCRVVHTKCRFRLTSQSSLC